MRRRSVLLVLTAVCVFAVVSAAAAVTEPWYANVWENAKEAGASAIAAAKEKIEAADLSGAWEKTKSGAADLWNETAETWDSFVEKWPEYKRRCAEFGQFIGSACAEGWYWCSEKWSLLSRWGEACWDWCAEHCTPLVKWGSDLWTWCLEKWTITIAWAADLRLSMNDFWTGTKKLFSDWWDGRVTVSDILTACLRGLAAVDSGETSAPGAPAVAKTLQPIKPEKGFTLGGLSTDSKLPTSDEKKLLSFREAIANLYLQSERGFAVYGVSRELFTGLNDDKIHLDMPLYNTCNFYSRADFDEAETMEQELREDDLVLSPQKITKQLKKSLDADTLEKLSDGTLYAEISDWDKRVAGILSDSLTSVAMASHPLDGEELDELVERIAAKAPQSHYLFVVSEPEQSERLIFCSNDGTVVRERYFIHGDARAISKSDFQAWWTSHIAAVDSHELPRIVWEGAYSAVYCLVPKALLEELKELSYRRGLDRFVEELMKTVPWRSRL